MVYLEKVKGFLKIINRLTRIVAGLIMSISVVIVLVSVFFRYVLRNPIQWSGELSNYLLIWITFLGAGLAIQEKLHVGIGFFTQRFPLTLQRPVAILNKVLILLFLLVVVIQGFTMAQFVSQRQFSPSLGISLFWPYLALPVGGLIMISQVLYLLLEDITEKKVSSMVALRTDELMEEGGGSEEV